MANFRIPLEGVTTAQILGSGRILNGNPGSPHGGMDLPAPLGHQCTPRNAGASRWRRSCSSLGKPSVVDHGLGFYTFYGHLSEIDAKAGDTVETGAVLGKVGATGALPGRTCIGG